MKKENTSPKADTVKITPKKSTPKFVDKQYKLTRETPPLSLILASRHTTRFPLLYFDEDTGLNRPLRYARNQNSPFQDEQDDNAIIEPIVFEDGFLHVRYRASETEDRRYKTWITGSAGGAATSSLDAMEVHFLSERAVCTLGANNFFLFQE